MKKFQIKHLFSTPYHPQTNGLVERFNRTLCELLAKLEETNNWNRNIAPVLFAYQISKHLTTGISPFYLMYRKELRLPIDLTDNFQINRFKNFCKPFIIKNNYLY